VKTAAYTVGADHEFHLLHFGELVEDMETVLREDLDEIYVKKTREVFRMMLIED
jgi:hypothetical protein